MGRYRYVVGAAPFTVNVSSDSGTVFAAGDLAAFTVEIVNDLFQPIDPQRVSATLSTPSGNEPVELTRVQPGQYVCAVLCAVPGLHVLTVSAVRAAAQSTGEATIIVR